MARAAGIGDDEITADQRAAATTTEADVAEAVGLGALLINVRVGGHNSFDRVVFDFNGPLPGHRVGYVDQVVQDGSGEPVPLRGRAFLQAVMTPGAAHDDHGAPTVPGPLPSLSNLAALRDLADAGDFEGVVTWGIGVAARTEFRTPAAVQPLTHRRRRHPRRARDREPTTSPGQPRGGGGDLAVAAPPGPGSRR